jgi:hypothetical protein
VRAHEGPCARTRAQVKRQLRHEHEMAYDERERRGENEGSEGSECDSGWASSEDPGNW